MRYRIFPASLTKTTLINLALTLSLVAVSSAYANSNTQDQHGFALYGDLKYPENFTHFSFANPDAPKGGKLRLMGFGTFDSLNPYTLKGISPFNTPGQFMYGFSELNETLLIGTGNYSPSGDESQSAYGLIAESISYPEDISWAEFKIRPNAAFHDNHKIDAHDVVYSYETLIKKGHPRFQQQLINVEKVAAINRHTVRVTFKEPNQRASILRIGELPVLPEHFWRDKDFERSSEIKPLLSGPYSIGHYEIGKTITLTREPEFWGKQLNVYQGRYNFDSVRIDYYRDMSIGFEAFKADEFDMFYDYTAKNWATAYDFPALKDGRVKKEQIPHKIPSGTQGFFFNTRRDLFADLRVRKALSLVFDFEWTNKALFNGAYKRNISYYPNSPFSARHVPSTNELNLLNQFKNTLPPELFSTPFEQPINQGNGRIRKPLKQAFALLKQAGWILKDGKLISESGQPFEFEILIRQAGIQRVILPYIKNLEKLGIKATARLLDAAQYKVRLDEFDFDMTTFVLPQGLSPNYEQRDYFHSSTRNTNGSLNLAGISHPAIDGLLEHVTKAKTSQELTRTMKALDRVLLWHHYIVPNWHLDYHRLAYWKRFGRPANQPSYKLGVENWWHLPDN